MSRKTEVDEMLAAYVDGVAELDADERRRVEELLRDQPVARAEADATRAVLGQLRALPPEGREPDWRELERQIHAAVALERPPRAWWRRWQWLVPVSGLVATGAVALLWLAPGRAVQPDRTPAPHIEPRLPGQASQAPAAAPEMVWLDGTAVDVGDLDPEQLPDEIATEDGSGGTDLLPAADLGWVDQLDDSALDRAESWLAKRKS